MPENNITFKTLFNLFYDNINKKNFRSYLATSNGSFNKPD